MCRLRAATAAVAIATMISLAGPASAENVLRWAFSTGALTFDPHSCNCGPDDMQQYSVYERLLGTSARLEVIPQLATAWRPVGAVT